MQKDKWIILDRDGVINFDSDNFIKSPQEWQALPGSLEAIAELSEAGFGIIIISNQSGIARELYTLETLASIHQKMISEVKATGGEIAKIYFCPHGPNDSCHCRKPLAGMFRSAAEEFNIELTQVYAIGDSVRDLEAALSAGAKPILVQTGKGPRSLATIRDLSPEHALKQVPVFTDLFEFSQQLLEST